MSIIELKSNFHHLIDDIDNEDLLMNFYQVIKSRYLTTKGQLWNRLTKQEREKLLLALG